MPTPGKTLEDHAWTTRHAWVRCVPGDDAQTLLWQLCEWIDDPTISREGLSARVNTWHQNAQKAMGSQAWTVRVDHRLGICLDQWLYLFERRMQAWKDS